MRIKLISRFSIKTELLSKSAYFLLIAAVCTFTTGCSTDNMRLKQPLFGSNGENFGRNTYYSTTPTRQNANFSSNTNFNNTTNYTSQQFQNPPQNYNSYINSEVTGSLGNNFNTNAVSSRDLPPVATNVQKYKDQTEYQSPNYGFINDNFVRPAPRPQWNVGPSGVEQTSQKSMQNIAINSGNTSQSAYAGSVQVREGDNLNIIARRYNIQLEALANANNLKVNDQISAGQMLNLPMQNWNNITEKPAQKLNNGLNTISQQNSTLSTGQSYGIAPTEYRPPVVQYQPWKRSSQLTKLQFAQNEVIMNDAAPIFIGALAPRPATRPSYGETQKDTLKIAQNSPQYGIHEGKLGETYTSIAKQYGLSASIISHSNGATPSGVITQGQKIIIPGLNPQQIRILQAANSKVANDNEVVTGSLQSVTQQNILTNKFPIPPQKQASVTSEKNTENNMNNGSANSRSSIAPIPLSRNVAIAAINKAIVANDNEPLTTGSIPQTQPQEKITPSLENSIASNLKFRWPAKGRVVSSFGSKIPSGVNEGINISVPEGTSVKAAEDGIVAYTGSELKGYGNLVLISHSNGMVTAYAHNSEILVKKGEKVSRGQVISKAGQTGAVSQPQIHFEIRKNTQPIDPMKYLSNS